MCHVLRGYWFTSLDCCSGNMYTSKKVFLVLELIVTSLLLESSGDSDYYEILGVSKDASSREIRKAFKKLAVTLHPDKNQADPDAHATFVKLTKAYETLKDPVSRKKYDLHGEVGKSSSVYNQGYHSWSYYHDNFGIYDDDPEIITLSKAEFELRVLEMDYRSKSAEVVSSGLWHNFPSFII